MAQKEIESFLSASTKVQDSLFKTYDEATFNKWKDSTTAADMSIIRPSGNPMTMDMFKGMLSSGKISDASSNLVSVDSVRLLGLFSCWPLSLPVPPGASAVVTYTSHDVFKYDGNPNDDLAKFSAVLEKGVGGWKFAHQHRATGQTPK